MTIVSASNVVEQNAVMAEAGKIRLMLVRGKVSKIFITAPELLPP